MRLAAQGGQVANIAQGVCVCMIEDRQDELF